MGQAKQRKAEIDQLKSQGSRPKFSAKAKLGSVDTSGFKPDAGMATARDQDCHLWFQVAELVQGISHGTAWRGYVYKGVSYVELNILVDIMDQAGNQHLAPQQDGGYMATIALTADNLRELAGQIRKGAMSVRITGRRSGHTEIAANSGEHFEPIWFKTAWSAGNSAGHMSYMFPVDGRFVNTDSNRVADFFVGVAEDVASRQTDLA